MIVIDEQFIPSLGEQVAVAALKYVFVKTEFE
jgi:hypothetical protein